MGFIYCCRNTLTLQGPDPTRNFLKLRSHRYFCLEELNLKFFLAVSQLALDDLIVVLEV